MGAKATTAKAVAAGSDEVIRHGGFGPSIGYQRWPHGGYPDLDERDAGLTASTIRRGVASLVAESERSSGQACRTASVLKRLIDRSIKGDGQPRSVSFIVSFM
jgi:hypothetical protein